MSPSTRCYVLLCVRWSFLLVARYVGAIGTRTSVRTLEVIVFNGVKHLFKNFIQRGTCVIVVSGSRIIGVSLH